MIDEAAIRAMIEDGGAIVQFPEAPSLRRAILIAQHLAQALRPRLGQIQGRHEEIRAVATAILVIGDEATKIEPDERREDLLFTFAAALYLLGRMDADHALMDTGGQRGS